MSSALNLTGMDRSLLLGSRGLELTESGVVRWHGSSADHPRNWQRSRKAYDSSVILLLKLITTMNGTAGTSAADQAQQTYGIDRSLSIFVFTSTYLLGQAVGGIFFPPFSEIFGRKSLYVVSTLSYCIVTALVAAVPSLAAAAVFRFIAGVLSAIAMVVVAGSIEDIFNIRARVWMMFAWTLTGTLGLATGPIMSTWVTVKLGWRWVFYIASIVTGAIFVMCLFLKESRPSLLLQRKVTALGKEAPQYNFECKNPDRTPDFDSFIHATAIRPVKLLFTEPIIAIVATMDAVASSLFYLQAESFLVVYESFGFSGPHASLAQIPIAIGGLLGVFLRFYDHRLLSRLQACGKPLIPEDKIFGFAVAAPALAISLWWFAWTIPPKIHIDWAVSMVSLIFTGFAVNEFVYTLSGYIADSYTVYAASAFSSLLLTKSLLVTVLVPFTYQMFTDIPANDTTSVLAAIATVFCAAPYVLIKYGKRIRESSIFACYSLAEYHQNHVENDMNLEPAAV